MINFLLKHNRNPSWCFGGWMSETVTVLYAKSCMLRSSLLYSLSPLFLFFTFSSLITQGWSVLVKKDIGYASISCITLSLPAISLAWIWLCCLNVWPRVDQKISFNLYVPVQVVENPTGSGVSFWFQFCMYKQSDLQSMLALQALAAIPSIDSAAVQQRLDHVRTYYELLNMPFEASYLNS